MAAITVGTNSWITEAEADSYFESRLGASDWWVDGGPDSVPAIITAYQWLSNSKRFSFPTTATQSIKDAQCEMALFLLQHRADIDLRLGLQAQGVVSAGIVKERYDLSFNGIPVPATVLALIDDYNGEHNFYIGDLERDSEQKTSYDAPGNIDRSS